MAQACHSCKHSTDVIHCVTESLNFCLTCDFLRHCNNLHEEHVRYQVCDNCKRNPALLLCCDDEKALCQSCFSRCFSCTTLRHRIQLLNRFPPPHHNTTNQHHEHAHMPHVVQNSNHEHEHVVGHHHQRREGMFEMPHVVQNSNHEHEHVVGHHQLRRAEMFEMPHVVQNSNHEHEHVVGHHQLRRAGMFEMPHVVQNSNHENEHVVGHHQLIRAEMFEMPHVVQNSNHEHEHVVGHHHQRRAGMFEMSCNGNNNCERWMFAMRCESCLASDAVVYCRGHDKLLCHNCDRVFHLHEAVPPHLRCMLCGNCKRPSRNFLIGAAGHQFTFPPTIHPPAAEEVSASPSTGLNQQDNDLVTRDDSFRDNEYSQDIYDFSWFGG